MWASLHFEKLEAFRAAQKVMPASSGSQASLAEVAREVVPGASPARISRRRPMKSLSEKVPSSKRSSMPKKDLRHLDSRAGVRAALKVEKGDTRWDPSPRFSTPPSSCYIQRARPKTGVCGDDADRVLDNIIRNRPISEVERGRVKENRMTLRKHVGVRDGHQLFVPSFQQEHAQDEQGLNIRVNTRSVLSSGRDMKAERPKEANAKLGSPEPSQSNGKLSNRGELAAKVNATPQQALAAAIAEADITTRSRQQTPNGTKAPAAPYVSSKWKPGEPRNGMMAWGASGRPPPSASSSKLSESNLKEHERAQEDFETPRSAKNRSSRRSGSKASSRSSRSGKEGRPADVRSSSTYAESDYGADSAVSEPLRQVNWDQLVSKAEQQGAAFRRSQSVDVLDTARSTGSESRRRLRGPGNTPNDTVQDLFTSTNFPPEEPYKRWRGAAGGAPPPQKIQGVFDRDNELAQSSNMPYRRLRSIRTGTPPQDNIPGNLGMKPGTDPMFPTPVATLAHNNKELLSPSQMPYRTFRRVRSARTITPPPDKLPGSLGMQPSGYDPIYPTPLQVAA
mmetsp:Transcript_85714/g.151246  ORF Transcript_85714/g.151246 Transcript_85714/m.151246 type:complete len:564 (+) Transcript_85714:1-1692(+)